VDFATTLDDSGESRSCQWTGWALPTMRDKRAWDSCVGVAIFGGSWDYGWGSQDDQGLDRRGPARRRSGRQTGLDTVRCRLGAFGGVVDEALKGVSEGPYGFTKCGMIWETTGTVDRVAFRTSIARTRGLEGV